MLQSLDAAFTRASAARPEQLVERTYYFAGQPVRVRVVGRALAAHIARPFAHLAAPFPADTPPALAIDLWDEAITGVSCPVGWDLDAAESGITAVDGVLPYSFRGRLVHCALPNSATWYSLDRARMIGWRASADRLSPIERTRPLPVLLSLWYRVHGVQIVHGGLVARDGRGVLLVGPSGSGKSTASLACLYAGFAFLGDDHTGLQPLPDGTFSGHSLFGSCRLDARQLASFPRLAAHAHPVDDPEGKALLFPPEVFPDRAPHQARIDALALPIVVGRGPSRIRHALPAEALRALAPSTLLQMAPAPGSPGLARMAQLVRRIPSYHLDLGSDIDDIPACIDRMLAPR